jgi:hypothetical protein
MAHYAVTKYGEHDPACRYDFKSRAERVIQDSRGTVNAMPRTRTKPGRSPSRTRFWQNSPLRG